MQNIRSCLSSCRYLVLLSSLYPYPMLLEITALLFDRKIRILDSRISTIQTNRMNIFQYRSDTELARKLLVNGQFHKTKWWILFAVHRGYYALYSSVQLKSVSVSRVRSLISKLKLRLYRKLQTVTEECCNLTPLSKHGSWRVLFRYTL